MVCPQHTRKLSSLSIFGFVHSDFEILEDSSICYLCFPVHLRVVSGCKPMSDVQVVTEFFESSVIELLIITSEDGVGKLESTDN